MICRCIKSSKWYTPDESDTYDFVEDMYYDFIIESDEDYGNYIVYNIDYEINFSRNGFLRYFEII